MLTGRSTATLGLPLLALVASAVACSEARQSTPLVTTDCSTCHGFPPAKDAHAIHFAADTGATGGIPHAAIACFQCHKDVQSVNDPDHLVRADGTPVPPPAEVRFDDAKAIAATTQPGATRAGAPAYDKAARTCSNVYCHGAGLPGPTADVVAAPAWDAPAGSIGCGKCHGIPPANHPAGLTLANCTQCHGGAIDATGQLNPETHANGKVDLAGAVTTSCSACHGDRSAADVPPGDPRSAPPTDAEGRDASDPTATSIGAHQNHAVAGVLGVAVACSECHAVPTSLLAAGHLDNQVTVTFGPLASKGGLTPTYDKASQTCSNVYCHGNFPFSKVNLPPLAPTWRGGDAAVRCGSCHDLPPPPPAHVVIDVATQGCGTSTNPALQCHPAAYTPSTVDPKLHIDGKICPPFCGP